MRRVIVIVGLIALLAACATANDPAPTRPLFVMSEDEIDSAIVATTAVARTVGESLATGDQALYESVDDEGAYIIDPIVSSLRPAWYEYWYLFQRLCEATTVDEMFSNADGAASTGACDGFFAGLGESLPAAPSALRHLTMPAGLVHTLIHLLDVDEFGSHPRETSDAIGFNPSRAEDVTAQVNAAHHFIDGYVAAWQSGDAVAISALFTDEGGRYDPFAGLTGGRPDTDAWISALLERYDTVDLEVESLYFSALGPGAVVTIELSGLAGSCNRRMALVWEVDEAGAILKESVFYEPGTVLSCGWAAS